MSYEVYIENTAGNSDTFTFNRVLEEHRLGEPWTATIVTQRSELDSSNLNFEAGQAEAAVIPASASDPTDDHVVWGRLDEVRFEGTRADLIVNSWEQSAKDTPLPTDEDVQNFNVVAGSTGVNGTGLELRYEDVRGDVIFNDMVGHAQIVEAGTVGTTADTYTVSFSNLSPAKIIRQQEMADEMFAVYNYDKTVDYVADPGRDRTDVTLHPSAGVVNGQMKVTDDGFDDGYSHILLLGAGGGGSDQISATVTLDDTVEIRREKRLELKNVYDQSRLDAIAEQLEAELQRPLVEVEVPVWRVGEVGLGDTFTVNKPSEGVENLELDVVEYERSFTGGVDSYDLTLSSRKQFREDWFAQIFQDLESYRTSKEPPVVHTTVSNSDPVGDGGASEGDEWDMTIPLEPDIVHERRAVLEIRADGYISRSKGGAGGGGVVADDGSFPNGATTITTGQWEELAPTQFDIPANANDTITTFWMFITDYGSASSINVDARVTDAAGSSYTSETASLAINDTDNADGRIWFTLSLKMSDMPQDEILEWEVNISGSGIASDVTTAFTAQWYATDEHGHEPDPGLFRFDGNDQSPALFPENPVVKVAHPDEEIGDVPAERTIDVTDTNRWSTLSGDPSNPGSSPWEAVVDIRGLLETNPSNVSGIQADDPLFNQIFVESDEIGEIEATFSGRYALENTFLPAN